MKAGSKGEFARGRDARASELLRDCRTIQCVRMPEPVLGRRALHKGY